MFIRLRFMSEQKYYTDDSRPIPHRHKLWLSIWYVAESVKIEKESVREILTK